MAPSGSPRSFPLLAAAPLGAPRDSHQGLIGTEQQRDAHGPLVFPPGSPALLLLSPGCHTASYKRGARPLGRTKARNCCRWPGCCAAVWRTPVRRYEVISLEREGGASRGRKAKAPACLIQKSSGTSPRSRADPHAQTGLCGLRDGWGPSSVAGVLWDPPPALPPPPSAK